MKKVLFALLFATVVFAGCQKAEQAPATQEETTAPAAPSVDTTTVSGQQAPAAPATK